MASKEEQERLHRESAAGARRTPPEAGADGDPGGAATEPRGGHPATPKEEHPMRSRAETGRGREQEGGDGAARPVVAAERVEFLIAAAPQAMGHPWLAAASPYGAGDLEALADQLNGADIEIVEKIAPHGILAVQAGGAPAQPTVVVARMTREKARALGAATGGRLIVARNEPLALADAGPQRPRFCDPAVARPLRSGAPITVEVQGNGKPLPNAQIYAFGRSSTAQAVTGANGRAQLVLLQGEAELSSLAVIPAGEFWSRQIDQPLLDAEIVNTVELRPLAAALGDFPATPLVGWGQRALRLDQLPAGTRGRGVRIAVIDSGVSTAHRSLAHIRNGFDFPRNDPAGWTQDLIGHGSHCAGIINAGDEPAFGIRGIAPEAELHVLKVMPDGHVDDLIKALHHCMRNDIDVVHVGIESLGGLERPELLAAALEPLLAKAKAMGIACIVPAGNTAAPLGYPACSPSVLAVGAVGKLGEFPADSYHASLPLAPPAADGLFLPRFGCFGPGMGLAAPGVAVVSSVPENGFAAWDGTSMAAAHVVGLAALVLAHNSDFQGAARNGARVDHLFDVLRQTAQPLPLGDPAWTGAGLPNAVRALQPWGAAPSLGGLRPEQQAELARRVAEAVRGVLSPAL